MQTATFAMVVDHSLEVLSHVPVPYWQLSATFTAGDATWTVVGKEVANRTTLSVRSTKHTALEPNEKDEIEKTLASTKRIHGR